MKMLLLAAGLLALGGCVAPGYHVQPDYAGGGYYGSGYYQSAGGQSTDYYDDCCSGGVSIGFGYGYPAYYGGGGYPYYGYDGGYYNRYHGSYYGHDGHHGHRDWSDHHGGRNGDGHHRDHDGHSGDHHGWHDDDHHDGHDGHMDRAVQRWPSAHRWNAPDHPSAPDRDAFGTQFGSAPQRQMSAPEVTQHFAPRSQSGTTGGASPPARSWTPSRTDTSSKKEF